MIYLDVDDLLYIAVRATGAPVELRDVGLLEAAAAGLGVAIAPQPLVADDLAAGRLVAPWGFVESPARLALWVPGRSRDGRAERLALWLGRELGD